jgi:hypothetical protein
MHYTSEGKRVKAFNVCTNTQLPDFATGLPGANAFAHRILPDGGELVADSDRVVRLSSSGAVVKTYTPSTFENTLFALNRDPDGTSFWTADLISGDVFRFDIASGAQLSTFSVFGVVPGISILGELCAGGCGGGGGNCGAGVTGCIFQVELRRCVNLHVGYNRFPDGTLVRWNISQNSVFVSKGQFTAIGGGVNGSATYHFLTQPIGATLSPTKPDAHVHFHWTIKGVDHLYVAIRSCTL